MKKVLSVVLAVMMLFSFMSIGTSAASDSDYYANIRGKGNFIVLLDIGECTVKATKVKGGCTIYTNELEPITNPGAMLSDIVVLASDSFTVEGEWELPECSAPSDYEFKGWICSYDGIRYAGGRGSRFTFPSGVQDAGVIIFEADYALKEEGDTMATILSVLTKVFGAIIGIFLYGGDTEAGVAMVDKILGGLEL